MNIGSSTESIGMRDMPQSRFTAPLRYAKHNIDIIPVLMKEFQ